MTSESNEDRPSKIANESETVPLIKPRVSPTHMVTLSVTVGTEDEWTHVYDHMAQSAAQLAGIYSHSLTSTLVEEFGTGEEDSYLVHSDTTLVRVEHAMIRAGLTRDQAGDAINELLNSGILFRERAR